MSSVTGHSTHATRVAAELRAAILSGALAPGRKLNLSVLRNRYGVSLSPLREAVTRLACEHLVVAEDHRGVRVAPVSAEDLRQLTELRVACFDLALKDAIQRGDLDWEGRVLAASHRWTRAERSVRAMAAADVLRELVSGSAQPMLLDFCAVLENLLLRYANLAGPDTTVPSDLAPLVGATVARKPDLARALLRALLVDDAAALRARWAAVQTREETK